MVPSTIVQRHLIPWWKRIRAWLGTSAAERAVSVAMVFCIALGLWFRVRGFLFEIIPFWHDEASWAIKTVTLPLGGHRIRPIGFMAVSKFAATVFGLTETALRLFPWCAGVLLTVALPWISRRLYGSWAARLLFVAVIALHPAAIDLAKEFKPYSVSLALHVALLGLGLSYLETGRRLSAVLATAVLGGLFAQDLVFAYPGLFLVIGFEAYRKRRRRELVAVVAAATLIILLLAAQYFFIWYQFSDADSEYWGDKYKVFNTTQNSYLSWWLSRYSGMADIPGMRRDFWSISWLSRNARQELETADELIWTLLHVGGLAVIALRRQWQQALLLVLPIATVTLFNAIGFWPLGAFRTNLFLVAYMAAIAGKAFDTRGWNRHVLPIVPGFIFVVLPLFLFSRHWHDDKRAFTYSSEFPRILKKLMKSHDQLGRGREPLLIDTRACKVWRYYVEYHPDGSQLQPELAERFDARCAGNNAELRRGIVAAGASGRLNWLLAHDRIRALPPVEELLGEKAKAGFEIVKTSKIGVHRIFAYRGPKGAAVSGGPRSNETADDKHLIDDE